MSNMTISIQLDHSQGDAPEQLERALAAIGFVRETKKVRVDWKYVGDLTPRDPADPSAGGETYTPPPPSGGPTDPVQPVEAPAAEKPKRGRKPKAVEEKPLISTGEPRVDPEDAEQDAADEELEAAAPRELTHDDVRNALMDYANKFGIPAAQADGPKVLELRFGKGVTKVSQIPLEQSDLAQAIRDIRDMLEKNPFERKVPL